MESILDAVEELVAEVGYAETTTNALAARAGISPGSHYQFFGNKAELLTGLLDRYVASFDAYWEAHLGEQTRASERGHVEVAPADAGRRRSRAGSHRRPLHHRSR